MSPSRHGRAALTDVHGTWLVAIVSGHVSPTEKFLGDLLQAFSDGPVVIGPTAPMLTAAYHSASEAISGMNAVAGWSGAPRPVLARELLPERALMGDASAIVALHTDVMRPLADAGPTLIETLEAYLDCGGAIEACARKLFVHPNTVRYRLKRITDFTGRDPTQPRDAYVLRVAATVGQLNYPTPPVHRRKQHPCPRFPCRSKARSKGRSPRMSWPPRPDSDLANRSRRDNKHVA